MPVPAKYRWVPEAVPEGSPYNVAQLYVRLGEAIRDGKPVHPGFDAADRPSPDAGHGHRRRLAPARSSCARAIV